MQAEIPPLPEEQPKPATKVNPPKNAAEAIKMALRRKGNLKLVEHKAKVKSLVGAILNVDLPSCDVSEQELTEFEASTDELGLDIFGEHWGERLHIKRKAGGFHFDETEREDATAAQARLTLMHLSIGWRKQIRSRANEISTTMQMFGKASGVSLSKEQILKRLTDNLNQLIHTCKEILEDGGFKKAVADMQEYRVPQQLEEEVLVARTSAWKIAEFATSLALRERDGLCSERVMTQRFRAPQSLVIVDSASALVRAVCEYVDPAECDSALVLSQLEEARSLVGKLAASTAMCEEEDDAI